MEIRQAGPEELDAIVELAGLALGWRPGEPNRDLFEWKHVTNAFGPSALWVAEIDGVVAGFRALLRWEFATSGGEVVAAVRPVDTATHPDFRGRGVFRRLTERALEAAEADGAQFVFNTPNDQSRPGYLKMGWQVAGRVPIASRPSSAGALLRMARSREPAAKWSEPTALGTAAAAAFADEDSTVRLLANLPVRAGLGTHRSPTYLRWRYGGLDALHYRAVLAGSSIADGVAVVRLRRRGAGLEAVLADLLVPNRAVAAQLRRRILHESGADYLLAAGEAPPGFAPMPGQGPILTTRDLAHPAPPLAGLNLTLGDVELF